MTKEMIVTQVEKNTKNTTTIVVAHIIWTS